MTGRAIIDAMNLALRKPVSLAEFLDWEERQEARFEFDGFQPVAMAGETVGHETIGGTLRALLHDRLRGKPCRPRGPTLKVEVTGRIRYPDAFVYCQPAALSEQIIRDPVVVFEVVSPGSSHTDRIAKLREYQATPSIQRYVILEQDSIAATIFARDGEAWVARALIDGDAFAMPEIGIELALSDIYADIELPPAEDRDDAASAG